MRYGAFGYCNTAGIDACIPRKLGYILSGSVKRPDVNHSAIFPRALDHLTYGFVMHPIATVFSGIAMIIAFASKRFGLIACSVVTIIAFICSIVAMAVDLALTNQMKTLTRDIRHDVDVSYGAATWVTVGAMICLLLATFTSLLECCCGGSRARRHDRY